MRKIFDDLFNALGATSDKRTKLDLARIIRREIENELKDNGVHSTNFQPTPREISIADSGKKLEAVKLYKNRTGRSLIEAKHEIEAHMTTTKPRSYEVEHAEQW